MISSISIQFCWEIARQVPIGKRGCEFRVIVAIILLNILHYTIYKLYHYHCVTVNKMSENS